MAQEGGVMNGKAKIPTKAWKTKYAKLTAERKTLTQRYLALKEEVKGKVAGTAYACPAALF